MKYNKSVLKHRRVFSYRRVFRSGSLMIGWTDWEAQVLDKTLGVISTPGRKRKLLRMWKKIHRYGDGWNGIED